MTKICESLASEQWYSTQTTAYMLLALGKFVGNHKQGDLKFAYNLNGNKQSVKTTSAVSQITLDFPSAGNGQISIVNQSQNTLFANVILDGIPLMGAETDESNDLSMSVRYLDMAGQAIDVGEMPQGTDFMAEVSVHHPGIRGDYKEMALTQIFPSGWEIRNLRMDNAASAKTMGVPTYQDIRDDRVHTYFDLGSNQQKTFRVLLYATYAGRFYLPGVHCGAMYNNKVSASHAGQWVVVAAGTEN
ncbi:MAG: hypothetical protein HC896_09440 [Bacteroidales bacterium]|nr:hypothetical protein [Bacteroidales bacterium]